MPRKVGMVFQEANLLPWLSALDNVAFPLKLRGVPKAERRAAAARMLTLTGLAGFEDKLPHQLSGGMKQRVAIARGLVQDPAVLLMDEPFASLDEQTRMLLGDELLRIWSETRKTVIFVTHSLNEAVYLADRVIVLSARPGRIVDDVTVDLPRPRSFAMTSTERFGVLKDRIWQHIRNAERAMIRVGQAALYLAILAAWEIAAPRAAWCRASSCRRSARRSACSPPTGGSTSAVFRRRWERSSPPTRSPAAAASWRASSSPPPRRPGGCCCR